ncbi:MULTISPECIES: hypothetical protein [unclassified Rhodococcus (in: high G+C Gram-positive bacteria)]|uniref:hypothetical protein n=1 Tax=unclassified Rhodococcus (in: high G+C Gram-positive bacteria) TaxID=192944 RepID=UPI0002F2862F|nr:hypothetical protein [Rhodococcus sp. DK17]
MHDPGRRSSLIEAQLPIYEQRILRTQVVCASAPEIFAALRRVDFFRSPVVALPNLARIAIDALRARRCAHIQRSGSEFRFDQLLEPDGGFQLLAEEPDHALVLGFIGRWWEQGYGRVEWAPADFGQFSRPGYGLGAWGFAVLAYDARTSILVAEVRVHGTDERARRMFRRYWTVVGPFVKAMSGPILRLIRDEAESRPRFPRPDGAEESR